MNQVNYESMKKILFILQNFLKLFLIFTLIFIWARYFIRTFWIALLVTTVITICIDFATRFIGRKKFKVSSLKLQEKEDAENMFLSLTTNGTGMTFFTNLAKTKHENVSKKTKYIIITHNTKQADGTEKSSKTILYPCLQFSMLSADQIAIIMKQIQKENAQKLVICCYDLDKNAAVFGKNFDIQLAILDRFDTYQKLYKPYAFFPEITMSYRKDKKMAIKDLFAYSFNKGRTKGYVFSAFVLFLSSLFVRANLYYCIMASLLLVFALISYFNPVFNPKQSNEIL